jgi:hypothetical protein
MTAAKRKSGCIHQTARGMLALILPEERYTDKTVKAKKHEQKLRPFHPFTN